MAARAPHDPFALFRFAVAERDWVLADLLASAIASEIGSAAASMRLAEELGGAAAGRQGAPKTLRALRIWATLSRELERSFDARGDGSDGRRDHG